jgi:hypothetical protein
VLQSVLATSGVREHFMSRPPPAAAAALANGGGEGAAAQPAHEGELTVALRRLVFELHTGGEAAEPVKPTELLQAVSNRDAVYAKRGEQDSHEVLRQLLEGLRSEEVRRLQGKPPGPSGGGAPAMDISGPTPAEALSAPRDGGGGPEAAATEAAPPPRPFVPDPTTFIDELYSGDIRSSIVCLSCGGVSCAKESFLDLSLPIPRGGKKAAHAGVVASVPAAGKAGARGGATFQEVTARLPAELTAPPAAHGLGACLQAFCSPETLHGEDAYACERCAEECKNKGRPEGLGKGGAAEEKRGEPAVKWLQVSRTPRALTLHLKRFRSMGRRVSKLDTHVPFPPVLDLAPFACAAAEPVKHFSEWGDAGGDAAAGGGAAGEGSLRLYGVVEHQGSYEGGHYVAFVRLGGEWYRMSDSLVRKVEEAEVYRAQAFMLFYERGIEDGAVDVD